MKKQLHRISKKQTSLLTGLLAVAVLLMIMAKTCSAPAVYDSRHRPSGGDTVDVAIEYGPLSLYRYNDTLGGFAYDFIRHIEASAGLPVKFHPVMTLSEALEGIDEGYYRMAVAAMPLSASLSRNYASTVPVFLDRQVYVQMLDDSGKVEVRTQLDLACRTVHVMSGSPVAERLRNLASEIGDTIYVVEDSEYGNEQLFILAATGEIPGAVVTERTAKALAADYPRADISTAVSFTQFQSWLLGRNDTILLHRIDSIIESEKSKRFYKGLEKRYF